MRIDNINKKIHIYQPNILGFAQFDLSVYKINVASIIFQLYIARFKMVSSKTVQSHGAKYIFVWFNLMADMFFFIFFGQFLIEYAIVYSVCALKSSWSSAQSLVQTIQRTASRRLELRLVPLLLVTFAHRSRIDIFF